MSLREQYDFLFKVTYDGALRERFLSQPENVLKEQRLDTDEFQPLTQGRINRMRGESLARRVYYLNMFFSCFPRTTFVLTSACRSMEPLNSFFSSPHFLNCFASDGNFIDAFNDSLLEQVRNHADKLPYLPDLHGYERALYLLRTRQPHEGPGVEKREALDHTRPLVQAPHTLLRRFAYPITEIVEYIDYFTGSAWYRLAPLYAAAGESIPTLVVPHGMLAEPLLVLLILKGTEHRILKIKPSQYEALAACDGTGNYDQVLEAAEPTEIRRVAAWLDYCWQKNMLEYLEP